MAYIIPIPERIFKDLRPYYNNQNGILNIDDKIALIKETSNTIEDYRKGFLDGMSVNKHYPQTLSILGYNFDEILKILNENREKKPTHLMIKDVDGDTQKVDILEIIAKLTEAGWKVHE